MRSSSLRPSGWVSGLRSSRSGELLVPVSRPSLLGLLLVNVGRVVSRLVRTACHHPLATLLLLGGTGLLHVAGPRALVPALVLLGVVCLVWWRAHPRTFRRVVVSPYRAAVVYGRLWQPAMVTCGLDVRMDGVEYLPRVRRVVSTQLADRVLVQLLPGQAPEQFESASGQLAHTFSALRCRTVVDRPGRVWLEFTHGDPLTEVVRAVKPPDPVNLAALPIGRREDGSTWAL